MRYYSYVVIALAIFVAVSYVVAGIWIFCYLPDDYLQGDLVKIMYIHVPCAWISLASYILLGLFSIFYLVHNDRFCSILAQAATIVSLHSCIITLVTGAIWGKAAWGAWWVWDPRLTAVFIQFCLLLVCYMMRGYASGNSTVEQSTALVTILGLINIPVIKFAVNAWNSIHQNASVFRVDGARIHPDLLYPLLLSFFAISCFYLLVGLLIVRNQIAELKKLRRYR